MNLEQIGEIRASVDRVGHIAFNRQTGVLCFCDGVQRSGLKSNADALAEIQKAWNELPGFMQEFYLLMEDNQRMRLALESVQASSLYAMTGTTARSSNPADYYQAMDAKG